jgi:glycosyltransferase involved in cell wall biosynthesis
MACSNSEAMVTTVIPTYRRPKLLRRAIKSVLAQTYPHLQVCVYDNASGDETAAVVRELAESDPRVKYHCHAENIGALRNFSYGMEKVDTPFFSLLSDDDILLPDFLQKALEGFGKHPEAIFSSLATIHIDETGKVMCVPLLAWQAGFYPAPEGLRAMLKYCHPEWTAILFRREVMEKVGSLDEETGAPADLDYELRTAARWPIVISREPGAVFVSHPTSLTSTQRLESLWPAWQKMIRNMVEDERIPYDVRLYSKESMLHFFRSNYIPLGGLSFIVNRDWRGVEQAAAILGHDYHRRCQALLLQGLSWTAQHLPPIYYVLSGLNGIRRSVRPLMNRGIQSKFGAHARLLDTANASG